MNASFWLGLAVIPAALVAAVILAAAGFGVAALWIRCAPSHWAISGPQRHARSAVEVLRVVNVAGGHAKTLRKLLRLGPWSVWVIRYAPDHVEEREPERIP